MGQFLSLQSLTQIAFGRPYIDVFGENDVTEDEENDDKREGKEERKGADHIVKVSLGVVRVTPRAVTFAPSNM